MDENIWLPQKRLLKDSACANFAYTAEDGKEYQTKGINKKQIRTLARLYDTLLPRPMSGEVRVKDAGESL